MPRFHEKNSLLVGEEDRKKSLSNLTKIMKEKFVILLVLQDVQWDTLY